LSPAGERTRPAGRRWRPASANFFPKAEAGADTKTGLEVRCGETPQPAREARALPRLLTAVPPIPSLRRTCVL